jgi:fluoride ion exporter CrcB/FEX
MTRRVLVRNGVCTAAGGAAGAVLRYLLIAALPRPSQALIANVITTAVAFAVVGIVLCAWAMRAVHALMLGFCGAATSVSAYSVAAAMQTPWYAAGVAALIPFAALAGLAVGILLCWLIGAVRPRRDAAV